MYPVWCKRCEMWCKLIWDGTQLTVDVHRCSPEAPKTEWLGLPDKVWEALRRYNTSLQVPVRDAVSIVAVPLLREVYVLGQHSKAERSAGGEI